MTAPGAGGTKIFADGANLEAILEHAQNDRIDGFTTNPTLMRQSGVAEYESFARKVLDHVTDRPVSFEVFSDDFKDMARQARVIASWAPNVFVKIPVTDTGGTPSTDLVRELTREGLCLNVTALLSPRQVENVAGALDGARSAIVSVFAGRVADTGCDPVPVMRKSLEILAPYPTLELLWASPREVLNYTQAVSIGCHIITLTDDLLKKLPGLGRDLEEVSLDTVRMFHRDAESSGYVL